MRVTRMGDFRKGNQVKEGFNIMPLNVALLREVQAYILQEPLHLNMHEGIETGRKAKRDHQHLERVKDCGTVCCIAGTAAMLSMRKKPSKTHHLSEVISDVGAVSGLSSTMMLVADYVVWDYVRNKAVDALGLDEETLNDLFYTHKWPQALQDKLRRCKPGSLAYAEVVSEAIDAYIRRHGYWDM